MTEDGLADLKGQNLYLLRKRPEITSHFQTKIRVESFKMCKVIFGRGLNNRSFIAYWKGDYPSWTRMGFVPKKLKILY